MAVCCLPSQIAMRIMSQSFLGSSPDVDAMLRGFEARIEHSVPFREDAELLRELRAEVRPVLEALASAYAYADSVGSPRALHDGLSLFNLLARRTGFQGVTPTALLALAHGVASGIEASGCTLSGAQRDELLVVALEGYAAGRDELRERELCPSGAQGQVCCALAPGCFGVFLTGAHGSERLERQLDEISRQLFRAEARSVLLDLARLPEDGEERARALLGFIATVMSLGTQVFVCGGTGLDAWRQRLGLPALGAQQLADFDAARAAALLAAGYELRRTGGLARGLIERVRPGTR
jgi:hypothetical protein